MYKDPCEGSEGKQKCPTRLYSVLLNLRAAGQLHISHCPIILNTFDGMHMIPMPHLIYDELPHYRSEEVEITTHPPYHYHA